MITQYTTASGSIYQVRNGSEVRRVDGRGSPEDRIGADWRPADLVEASRRLYIHWPEGTPLLPGSSEGAHPMTITSPIVDVQEITKV